VQAPKPDIAETTRQLHTELRRLGCYEGAADAPWGSDSRHALEQFNKRAGAHLDTRVASLDALGVVRAKTGRVCPQECKRGYRADGAACVKIVCRSGFAVGDDGRCEREQKPKSKTASRPDDRGDKATADPRSKGEAPTAQIICGSRNGCVPVPKGCRGELRAAGFGEVAMVNCNK